MKIAEHGKKFYSLAVMNAAKFSFNVLFAYLFQCIFGVGSILVGVAVCVGLTTLPGMDLGIRKLPMAGIIIVLYTAAGAVSQLALCNPWLALPANFLFVGLILLLSSEPVRMKTSISFLLCFIFCQANPTSPKEIGMRLLSLFTGGLIVAAVLIVRWSRKGIGSDGRTLFQQMRLCSRKRGYIFRSGLGIATAMLIASLANLERPMWISIVVMSLTQVEFAETKRRIMHRSMATVLGAAVFAGILIQYVPQQYTMLFVLLIGYISFFTSEYKYTQIVNAICALNASMLVLGVESAIVMRVFCLAVGIFVTLGMWKLQEIIKKIARNRERFTAGSGGLSLPYEVKERISVLWKGREEKNSFVQ